MSTIKSVQNHRKHLEGKHFVVQCEQGADFFVGPLSGLWLQDNYEGNFVHHVCMQATQAAGIPVYLLQTQTELDLERGIPKKELDVNIFGGRLQIGAFSEKICFREGLQEVLNGQGQPIKTPVDVLGLAIAMCTDAKDHKNAFHSYVGLDPAVEIAVELVHVRSFYMDFMLYLATNLEGQMPVAGGLETIAI